METYKMIEGKLLEGNGIPTQCPECGHMNWLWFDSEDPSEEEDITCDECGCEYFIPFAKLFPDLYD